MVPFAVRTRGMRMTRSWRWLTAPGLALALGCAGTESNLAGLPGAPVVARGQDADHPPPLQPVKKDIWTAPAPAPVADVPAAPAERPAPPAADHPVLSLTLDSVLKLAE